jgi:hypothetical protein
LTQKPTPSPSTKKGNSFLRAMGDLCILALLLIGAGFGGYFYGNHQQLAPLQKVPPGTAGANQFMPPKEPTDVSTNSAAHSNASKPETGASSPSSAAATPSSKAHGKRKFWIASNGTDYIGYSITVKVNDTPVDNFFGPGKSVDITRLVKPGSNTVELDAKQLGDQYNKHSGDASAALVLHVVSGPSVSDNYKSSDVLLTYKRNATQTEDATDTLSFTGE